MADNKSNTAIEPATEDIPAETPTACVVCGAEPAPTSKEGLCWVCRRLKLSAWADSDNQSPPAE